MMVIMISYFIDLISIDKLTFLRAERRRREARREKFTHENCTLPTSRPGPSEDNNDNNDKTLILDDGLRSAGRDVFLLLLLFFLKI